MPNSASADVEDLIAQQLDKLVGREAVQIVRFLELPDANRQPMEQIASARDVLADDARLRWQRLLKTGQTTLSAQHMRRAIRNGSLLVRSRPMLTNRLSLDLAELVLRFLPSLPKARPKGGRPLIDHVTALKVI